MSYTLLIPVGKFLPDSGAVSHCLATRGNSGFSVLPKDNSTCGLGRPGIEPPTFWLGDNHSTSWAALLEKNLNCDWNCTFLTNHMHGVSKKWPFRRQTLEEKKTCEMSVFRGRPTLGTKSKYWPLLHHFWPFSNVCLTNPTPLSMVPAGFLNTQLYTFITEAVITVTFSPSITFQ